MSNSNSTWSKWIFVAVIVSLINLVFNVIIFSYVTNQTDNINANYLSRFFISGLFLGLLLFWIIKGYYNRLPGSNSVTKCTILSIAGSMALILFILLLNYVVYPHIMKVANFSSTDILLSSILLLISAIFIGFIVGKIWDKFQ